MPAKHDMDETCSVGVLCVCSARNVLTVCAALFFFFFFFFYFYLFFKFRELIFFFFFFFFHKRILPLWIDHTPLLPVHSARNMGQSAYPWYPTYLLVNAFHFFASWRLPIFHGVPTPTLPLPIPVCNPLFRLFFPSFTLSLGFKSRKRALVLRFLRRSPLPWNC